MQRTILRIKRMLGARDDEPRPDDTRSGDNPQNGDGQLAAIHRELEAIHHAIMTAKHALADIEHDGNLSRACSELDAIRRDTEQATHSVLGHAEQIDTEAKKLAAAMTREGGEALASIQNRVAALYEACDFQDIAGQRIANTLASLRAIEGRIETALQALHGVEASVRPQAPRPALLNGPKLDGDCGHVSQNEIDRLFS